MFRQAAFVAAALIGLAASTSFAQDVLTQRKNLMKAQGAATAPIGRMLQGAEPYDNAKVQTALDAYLTTTAAFKDLFPPGTDQGETRALPAIFQNRDGFNAAVTKFETDARSAKAAVKDEASLKAEMPKVLANCGSCHTGFRKPQ